MRIKAFKQQAGMTLIELVIAVAITAIIGLISAQLLGAMIQNSQQITDHASELERLDRGLRVIQSDFDQLVVRGESSLVSAEDSSVPGLLIEFTRLHEQPNARGNASINNDQLERVRYVLESNNLVRYSTPVGIPVDEDHWYQHTLFTRLSEVNLFFLYNEWSTRLTNVSNNAATNTGTTPLGAIRFEAESDRWQHLELISMLRTGANP